MSKMAQKTISQGSSKTDFEEQNDQFMIQSYEKKDFKRGYDFFREQRALKIRLLQSYEVLWIHNFEF